MNNKTLRDAISKQCGFTPYKAQQVCNAGDWPTEDEQKRYWQERDEHLDRTESAAQWFDETNRPSPF